MIRGLARYMTLDSGQGANYSGIRDLGFGVWGLGIMFGIRDLGFRVWSFMFCVLCLGLRDKG